MRNDIISVANVHGYIDAQDTAWLSAEDVAMGFGFTQEKNGIIYVRWETVNGYLNSFGFSQQVGKGDYLPENMVYRLGFKANNETAIRFQAILADEVLPSLRKHGGYMVAKAGETPEELMSRALLVAHETLKRRDERIAALETETTEQKALITEQGEAIKEMQPKVSYCDIILQSPSTVLVTQIAQDYGKSAKAFNKLLHELGIQRKVGRQWVLYSQYIANGYVQSATEPMRNSSTGRTYTYSKWTQKGRIFLYDSLKSKGILPLIEQ